VSVSMSISIYKPCEVGEKACDLVDLI
jgi:hypothetical protein